MDKFKNLIRKILITVFNANEDKSDILFIYNNIFRPFKPIIHLLSITHLVNLLIKMIPVNLPENIYILYCAKLFILWYIAHLSIKIGAKFFIIPLIRMK